MVLKIFIFYGNFNMIHKGTQIKVADNSGAKIVTCIRCISDFKKQFTCVGDLLLVTVKSLRKRRRAYSKVKRGSLVKAIIIRQQNCYLTHISETLNFKIPSVVILNNNYKMQGTRVFGVISSKMRYTRFMKLISVSRGVC